MKTLRAFHINAHAKTVLEVQLDPKNTLAELQDAVGGLIEVGFDWPDNRHTVYVNEEGLYGDHDDWIMVEGAHQPFKGNAILAGFNPADGETVAATLTLEEVKAKVKFLNGHAVRRLVLAHA